MGRGVAGVLGRRVLGQPMYMYSAYLIQNGR